MIKSRYLETLIGFIVLIIAIAFVIFSYKTAEVNKSANGYNILAKFDSVDGLSIGSDVRVGGIKIGVVSETSLDSKTFQAITKLAVDKNMQIPSDSSAQIVSDGLLGSKYVSILPGSENNYLKNNEFIEYTQSSINLETLIGKFMFSGNSGKNNEEVKNKDAN